MLKDGKIQTHSPTWHARKFASNVMLLSCYRDVGFQSVHLKKLVILKC